ncbi:MAG: GAF domain-containing sensor histidine kinase [Anaerolineales bacterium]|nr:GAF domain-containing sensor histidine kinase [Anaerolineales bacterium]
MRDEPDKLSRRLLALDAAVLAISSDLSLSETLQRIVTAAAELVDARYGALGVPNTSGEMLVEFVTTGLTPEEEARIGARPRGHGILGVILHEGRSLRLADLRRHPRSVGFPPHHPPMKSFLGVPIRYKGKLLGNLYLTDKRSAPEFTEDDQYIIELLAAHAGIAIENARLYEKVQQLRVLEERQRIGMDLHDGVIQSIYAVGLNLELVNSLLNDGEIQEARDRVHRAIDALNATIRDIRAYILDLRPRLFDGNNLVSGLERLLTEFKANTLMNVEFSAEPSADKALSIEERRVLFHIAQEALSNTARHSRASQVEVKLLEHPDSIELSLRDNGRGFQLDAIEQRVGHGLRNMHERILAVGGKCSVYSEAGQGTEVVARVPRLARTNT